MSEPSNKNKVITLETLGTAIDKIEEDYLKKEEADSKISKEVTKQLQESGAGCFEIATKDDILALFDDGEDDPPGEIDADGKPDLEI